MAEHIIDQKEPEVKPAEVEEDWRLSDSQTAEAARAAFERAMAAREKENQS